jgi:hypothetical protein
MCRRGFAARKEFLLPWSHPKHAALGSNGPVTRSRDGEPFLPGICESRPAVREN